MRSAGRRSLSPRRAPPSRWGLTCPISTAAMRQAALARIEAPDDALLSALLVKLAHDRGLKLTPAILSHVLPRIERSPPRPFGASSRGSTRGRWRPSGAAACRRARPPLRREAAPVSPSRHDP
jgi:hypothetical protein